MNLKEAFRFQNKLNEVINTASCFLEHEDYVMKTTVEHLRKKVNADAEDETIDTTKDRPYAFGVNDLVEFLLSMLQEKEKLYTAIEKAKQGTDYDMDSQIDLNMKRQSASRILRKMSNIRSQETILRGRGSDYKFNAEGNQVQYYYDLKKVSVIDFDRKKVKHLANQLITKADEVSTKIDQIMVNTNVEYTPLFNVNDSFEEAVDTFLQAS